MSHLDELGHGSAHLFGVIGVGTENDDPELVLVALRAIEIQRREPHNRQETEEESDFSHGNKVAAGIDAVQVEWQQA